MSDGIDTVTSNATGNDTTIGGQGADSLTAPEPAQTDAGPAGNDTILGAEGADTITASEPADPLPDERTTEDRIAALEHAVRVMATTLYGPNGGGVDHVAEAAELYNAIFNDPDAA